MKKIYVNEKWCLACHLCEYNCAFANSKEDNMTLALKDKPLRSAITVEEEDKVSFAVSCRHCEEPYCVKSCLTGALTKENGIVTFNKEKCIGCYTCIVSCPYGAITIDPEGGTILKCQQCLKDNKLPKCVQGCPNGAIVYEER